MRLEYKHLVQFGLWMLLWMFVPWIAFLAMLFMVGRHFVLLRRHRLAQEVAAKLHANDARWAELEGFGSPECQEVDSSDWWK